MMIDFEDRQPAPPLSPGERAVVTICALLSVYGFAAGLASIAQLLAALAD